MDCSDDQGGGGGDVGGLVQPAEALLGTKVSDEEIGQPTCALVGSRVLLSATRGRVERSVAAYHRVESQEDLPL